MNININLNRALQSIYKRHGSDIRKLPKFFDLAKDDRSALKVAFIADEVGRCRKGDYYPQMMNLLLPSSIEHICVLYANIYANTKVNSYKDLKGVLELGEYAATVVDKFVTEKVKERYEDLLEHGSWTLKI